MDFGVLNIFTMRHSKYYLFYIIIFGIVCSSVFISSCRTENLDLYNPILIANDENELGKELVKTIRDNPALFNLLDESQYPKVYEYLNLAWWMVKNQTNIRDNFNWEILVLVDDNSLKAYTFPGGKFIITTGLLKQLSKENQLLSIMAHEAYYNDRVNQNAADALSPVMEKLKFMVSSNDGMGTKVFKDVINGISDMNIEMIGYCENIVYEPRTTFLADEYAINIVLCHYTYSPMGLKEILVDAESNGLLNYQWLNNRPPSLLNDPDDVLSFSTRKNKLNDLAVTALANAECNNSEDSIDSDEYLEMMEALP